MMARTDQSHQACGQGRITADDPGYILGRAEFAIANLYQFQEDVRKGRKVGGSFQPGKQFTKIGFHDEGITDLPMICIGEADDRSCILNDQKWTNNATGQTKANKLSAGFDISETLADLERSI